MSDLSDHGQYNLSFFVLSFFWTAAPKGCLTLNNTLFPCSHSLCCLTRPPANKPPPGVCDKWLVCLQWTPGGGRDCGNQRRLWEPSSVYGHQWGSKQWHTVMMWTWEVMLMIIMTVIILAAGTGTVSSCPHFCKCLWRASKITVDCAGKRNTVLSKKRYVSWFHHKFEQPLHQRWCLYYRKVFWLPDLLLLI